MSLELCGVIPQIQIDTTKLEEVLRELNSRLSLVETKMFNIMTGSVMIPGAKMPDNSEKNDLLDKNDIPEGKHEAFIDFEACEEDSERFAALHQTTIHLGNKLKKMFNDLAVRDAIQKSKDDAQDEVFKMELDRIHRGIKTRLGHQDLQNAQKVMDSKLTTLEVILKSELAERIHELESSQEREISKIVDQVNNIKQATTEAYALLEKRMQTGFTELKASTRPMRSRQAGESDAREDMDGISRTKFSKLELEVATLADKCSLCIAEIEQEKRNTKQLITPVLEKLQSSSDQIEAGLEKLRAELKQTLQRDLSSLNFDMNSEGGKIFLMQSKLEKAIATEISDLRSKLKASVSQHNQDISSLSKELREDLCDVKTNLNSLSHGRLKTAEDFIEAIKQDNTGFQKKAWMKITDLDKNLTQLKDNVEKSLEPDHHRVADDLARLLADFSLHKITSDDRLQAAVTCLNLEISKLHHGIERTNGLISETQKSMQTVKSGSEVLAQSLKNSMDKLSIELGLKIQDTVQLVGRNKVTMDSLFSGLERRTNQIGDQMSSVEKSNIAIAAIARQVEGSLRVLITKHLFWEGVQAKLQAHCYAMGDQCCMLESESSSSKPFSLSAEYQQYLAGNSVRIAKFLAIRADFETIKQISANKHPENEDWDQKVVAFRERYLNDFMAGFESYVAKKHPSGDTVVMECRRKFTEKLHTALKLALSKYSKVQPGVTLFGKRQLNAPVCMACDRPFTMDPGPGFTGSAKPAEAAPAHSGRIRCSSASIMSSDASVSSVDSGNEVETGSVKMGGKNVGGSDFGLMSSKSTNGLDNGRAKGQKFIYRGGFKIPAKERGLYPISQDLMNTQHDQVVVSAASTIKSRRPHTVGVPRSAADKKIVLTANDLTKSTIVELDEGVSMREWGLEDGTAKLPIISPF